MQDTFPAALQRRLERALIAGEFQPGARLTISDTARQFGVGEIDIAAVLLAAQRKGLVEPIEGREAAFCFLGPAGSAPSGVHAHAALTGIESRSEVQAVEVEPATTLVAAMLHLEEGDPVYRYDRTRYLGDEVVASQTTYIPYILCPGLDQQELARSSFRRLLRDEYNVVITDVKEGFEVSPATEQDVLVLGLPRGGLVLLVERLALSRSDWPVVWANIRVRADRFDYISARWPEAVALIADAR